MHGRAVLLLALNEEHLPEALLVAVLGEDAPVHRRHLPPGASRSIAHKPGRRNEELGGGDAVLVVFFEHCSKVLGRLPASRFWPGRKFLSKTYIISYRK